jgi:hypothetical protein
MWMAGVVNNYIILSNIKIQKQSCAKEIRLFDYALKI